MPRQTNQDASTTELGFCPRSQVRRAAKRASYDREPVYQLIDALKTAHLGFVEDGEPRVIPITCWRDGDNLYVHSGNKGRLAKYLQSGQLVVLSFAECSEWVMTKSAYHHSANYRSAVLYCRGEAVTDEAEFDHAFRVLINQLEPGRWEQVRPPNRIERKATVLVRLPMHEGSFKARTGGPVEEPEDMDLPIWHGTLPAR
ncbi:hypothetical protein BGP77_14975 [Saccharospirillum sp. MSK14-1]|uniref:pyridoxamine 5'-phosphate oxidase family protein n=1 Tax=Saccharospirillum sp. MSK14-1 TaxID=1897632 RepID=UPI000D331CA4|nr:pyridoxamine 5'-phosphate oxidase family protein [Saccharospirillum sp. MSK14-1]PTY37779.1 hypothetical protein BGP77_14975 [Saccharospirillum sp. MSK14-1]